MVEEQESDKLLFTPPPKIDHRYQGDQQKLQDIYAFLANTKWKTCTEEQPHGATWFELFVIWEQSGYNKDQTKQETTVNSPLSSQKTKLIMNH